MTRPGWSLEECLERGYLPTGEPLEAAFGTGWWTEEREREMNDLCEEHGVVYDAECPLCVTEQRDALLAALIRAEQAMRNVRAAFVLNLEAREILLNEIVNVQDAIALARGEQP